MIKKKTQIDPLLQVGRKLETDTRQVSACWPSMKMERKNDYKETHPRSHWPLLACGKRPVYDKLETLLRNQHCMEIAFKLKKKKKI